MNYRPTKKTSIFSKYKCLIIFTMKVLQYFNKHFTVPIFSNPFINDKLFKNLQQPEWGRFGCSIRIKFKYHNNFQRCIVSKSIILNYINKIRGFIVLFFLLNLLIQYLIMKYNQYFLPIIFELELTFASCC